jgi:MoaA/NifB/PqqE/SkfB family radical SAM enzyme
VIRKVYLDLMARKVRERGIGWLARRGRQYLLLHLSSLLGRPLCGPVLGTLMVTYRCNFHCAMCDMPLQAAAAAREGREEFDTGSFRTIIGEFARLGVPGIGFTGGEPLLRPDIFELLACTRQHGMIAHLNTNGWLLGEEEAKRIIEIGVDSVNVSLDGATPATHDRIRNCRGAFERATSAVARLHRLNKLTGSRVRVKTVAVIDETNLDEVPELIRLSRELGADCVEVIPRQPFAGNGPPADEALLQRVDRLVDHLREAARSGVKLENSPAHLGLFRRSFAGLPTPVPCSAGYNSLAVDCYGRVFPCVPWINWGKAIATVRPGGLERLWYSPEYRQHRAATAACRDCYLNCQTELNLLFSPRLPGRRGA